MLEMVVEPVTAKVLEVELKVKLVEVPMTLVPCPNKMSLAVKFWSWMVGVVPPVEVTEPLPLTAVTVPANVLVAIILPFWSTAKTEEVRPLPRDNWEIVVVANVEVPMALNSPEAERLVVEALPRVVCPVTANVPPTVKRFEIVVEPVMAKVLEVGLKIKLLDPAVEDAAVA
jgi:hypothetical protein